ncbi:hypothetical protein DYY67_2102 [Candidatus Nitrosotalea sp. TS]|uniref:hypothetical protein n=1 Tax=Candidatus Nitrosotalea sp. TS TaxID=2341020 RepID=UPI0014089E52|nr:hypothetical protein [Candidatus Nitrosotalea sp. TS]NHI04175.1 hypothetical protein [Candidatus Nitrosotalea sp. TS]
MSDFKSSGSKKKTVIVSCIAILLAIYFASASYFFPQFYLSLVQQYPRPVISDVKISNSTIHLGQSFEITVTGTNNGVTSDMQTLSVSFPNMTNVQGISVRDDNFTQHPVIIDTGQEVGSHYQGTQYPVYSQYPAVESYNRPWEGRISHTVSIDVTPEAAGKFLVFIKSVALPHSDIIHYPTGGIEDQQSEYVVPYSVNVTNP